MVLLRESEAIVDNGEEGGVRGGYGHSRFFFVFLKMDGLCKNKRDWFQPSFLTLLLCIYVFERVLMVGGGFLFSLVRGGPGRYITAGLFVRLAVGCFFFGKWRPFVFSYPRDE